MLQRLADALERRRKMIYIPPEDLPKLMREVNAVVEALGSGMQRVEQIVDLGDVLQAIPVRIVGYWVKDIIRIDIKLGGQK